MLDLKILFDIIKMAGVPLGGISGIGMLCLAGMVYYRKQHEKPAKINGKVKTEECYNRMGELRTFIVSENDKQNEVAQGRVDTIMARIDKQSQFQNTQLIEISKAVGRIEGNINVKS